MKTEYKRDLKNNYLVIEADSDVSIEEYIVHMTEQNVIPGLLPMQVRKMDGSCYVYYEITSRQPMETVFEKEILTYQDILHILSEVQKVLESVRSYLLNPQQILFDPQYIYFHTENKQTAFCYFPASADPLSVVALAEYILKKLDHEDTKAVSLGYSFYQHASEENFSLSGTLHKILEEDWKENKKRGSGPEFTEIASAADAVSEQEEGKKKSREEYGSEDEFFHKSRKQHQGQIKKQDRWVDRLFCVIHPAVLLGMLLSAAGLEGLLYLGWIDLTEAGGSLFLVLAAGILINRFWRKRRDQSEDRYGMGLDEECDGWMKESMKEDMENLRRELYQSDPKKSGYFQSGYREPSMENSTEDKTEYLPQSEVKASSFILVSESPEKYPSIRMSHRVLIIGKTKGQADILLHEAAVSRIHARIEQRQGSCYVRDLNSKNGTFLNGIRLKPQEEAEIREGDHVTFANIGYFASKEEMDPDRTQLLC